MTNEELQRVVACTCADYIRPLIPAARLSSRRHAWNELYATCDLMHFNRDPSWLYPTVEQMADSLVRGIWQSRTNVFKGPFNTDGFFHECRGLCVNAAVREGGRTLTIRIFGAAVDNG